MPTHGCDPRGQGVSRLQAAVGVEAFAFSSWPSRSIVRGARDVSAAVWYLRQIGRLGLVRRTFAELGGAAR
ncbi:uncharacterized protein TrAtP1_012333 [Trichoderma atroviride]|uniref:uncharacterized protein n=1 Tax=Hypocrea atroviridis TaxID=63577 RepID=UPI00332E367B|nr:hypothetical protein TrAtP1_012333 [Trichoderma atroviride]